SHQLHFTATTSEHFTESFTRVQTPQGLNSLGSVNLPWLPDSDVLTVHRLRLLRGERVIDILANGQKFEVVRRENNLEYDALDGALTAVLQPNGMEVGDVLDVAWSTRRESRVLPVSELLFDDFDASQHARVELRATWDKSVPMHWKASDALSGVRETRTGRLVELRFAADEIEADEHPDDAPMRFWTGPRIVSSRYASGNDLSKKVAPLYLDAARLAADSPLKEEARAIGAASNDIAARLEAVLRLAQDKVRYVYLGMDEGGVNPAGA